MTTAELMALMTELGVRVELRDSVPYLVTDAGKVPPEVVAVVRHHRAAILHRLGVRPEAAAPPPGPPAAPPPGRRVEVRGQIGRVWTLSGDRWEPGAREWRIEGDGDDAWQPIPEQHQWRPSARPNVVSETTLPSKARDTDYTPTTADRGLFN